MRIILLHCPPALLVVTQPICIQHRVKRAILVDLLKALLAVVNNLVRTQLQAGRRAGGRAGGQAGNEVCGQQLVGGGGGASRLSVPCASPRPQ